MPPASSAALEIASNSLENKSVFAAPQTRVPAHIVCPHVHDQQIPPGQTYF